MTAPDRYQWRRDKDGLGIWEHRGKVAVAGVGHSPVDRRWDGVSMDKTLGAYSILACRKAMDEAGVTPDQIDGVICCGHRSTFPLCVRAISQERVVVSRSRSFRRVSGNGGNQDSRRTTQLS